MKRTVIAIVAATAIFGAVYGLAASLGVTSTTLGAGSSVVAACQSGTVNVSYASSYSSAVPGYQVTTVTLSNLNETAGNCGGATARVTLSDGSNNSLGEQTATLPTGSGTTQAFTFSGVNASSVAGVNVVIG
jgi:hypothetical protein